MIIVHDQEIEFVNDKYLEMFMYQINLLKPLDQDGAHDSRPQRGSNCRKCF